MSSGISRTEVSRICAGLDEIVAAFRGRRLDHVEFPYVFLRSSSSVALNSSYAGTGTSLVPSAERTRGRRTGTRRPPRRVV